MECPWTALEQTTGKKCQEQKTHMGHGVFLSLWEFGEEVGGGGMRDALLPEGIVFSSHFVFQKYSFDRALW